MNLVIDRIIIRKRPKKLLLHKSEIKRLIGVIQRKGMTLVPLKMYFNHKNKVKILIAAAKGKNYMISVKQ